MYLLRVRFVSVCTRYTLASISKFWLILTLAVIEVFYLQFYQQNCYFKDICFFVKIFSQKGGQVNLPTQILLSIRLIHGLHTCTYTCSVNNGPCSIMCALAQELTHKLSVQNKCYWPYVSNVVGSFSKAKSLPLRKNLLPCLKRNS